MKKYFLWAIQALEKQGHCLISSVPEKIQDMPWSEVYRFETTQGNIYLKKTPPGLAIESNVIKLLAGQFNTSVPEIIAENSSENCFLMKDAGVSLRSYFKKKGFNQAIFINALNDYAQLQHDCIQHTQDFLKLRVPDWSLDKLPWLYEEVMQKSDLLLQVGFTSDEIKKCHQLAPVFHDICKRLSYYKIPNTFCHCDFHDNNILINETTHKTTLIDLGEVEITHPFFSLTNALYQIKTHFQLTDSHCKILQQEALKPWLKLELLSNLQTIMKLIQQCWFMHHVLGMQRIMESVDPVAFQSLAREGRLARKLRTFLEYASTKN